jgi:hypothetical protein
MDLEYTFWQMFYLCVAPARVYRTTKLHKQTKNQWARDDPAFVVVLACMVAVASLAYAIAFQVSSVWTYVRIVISAILFDFLLIGVVVASASWCVPRPSAIPPAIAITHRHTVAVVQVVCERSVAGTTYGTQRGAAG